MKRNRSPEKTRVSAVSGFSEKQNQNQTKHQCSSSGETEGLFNKLLQRNWISIWTIDLHVKAKSIKHPYEKHRTLSLKQSNLSQNGKGQTIKEKKIDVSLRQNFCSLKNRKIQRQATDWQNIFAIHLSDQGFVVKIHKESYKLKK